MRRAVSVDRSRSLNHKRPRFYTAWVSRVGLTSWPSCLVYPQQRMFPGLVGTLHSRQQQK